MSVPELDEKSLRGMTMQSFAGTALFDRTFDEGMALVEEAARYLDGRGKEEARDLPRKSAMLYASESLRVTTRLMQAASWLLVQRAVHEGDMPASDATDERYRLGSKDICFGGRIEDKGSLPKGLQDLLARSDSLYRRIARLEEVLVREALPQPGVQAQLARLEQAFGHE
jgi:regulator of CtrA degradation